MCATAESLHARHNLCDDNAVAVFVLENDRLLDRVVLRIHRDRTRADDEILRLLDRLAECLGIIRTRALERIHEQLARIVDELQIDVYVFGILADFRTRLFPGSQRLVELADRMETLPLGPLCWCGARGTHNARTVDGLMVTEGSQVVVGDTDAGEVRYEVLCRAHHRRRMTATRARATLGEDPLPFGD